MGLADLPKIGVSTAITEDLGVVAVHAACAQMQAIWRETSRHDMGVDGQVEFLEESETLVSTGKILAVQIKTGPSYFENETDVDVPFSPSQKHRAYWNSLNLPAILVLHHPQKQLTIYVDVKEQLAKGGPIRVPKSSTFTAASREALLKIVDADSSFDPYAALQQLAKIQLRLGEQSVGLNGVEMFLACLHPTRFYFELCAPRIVAAFGLTDWNGITGGPARDEAIWRIATTCERFKLTVSFLDEFEEFWYDYESIAHIMVGLTARGFKMLKCLLEKPGDFIRSEALPKANSNDPLVLADALMEVGQAKADRNNDNDILLIEARIG